MWIKKEDNDKGGKTVIIGSIGEHIVRIKRKIEETITIAVFDRNG